LTWPAHDDSANALAAGLIQQTAGNRIAVLLNRRILVITLPGCYRRRRKNNNRRQQHTHNGHKRNPAIKPLARAHNQQKSKRLFAYVHLFLSFTI
jgi:hypothetical protein